MRWYLDFLLTAPGVGVHSNGRKSGLQFVHERPQTALGGGDALRTLKAGEIDAALYVGGAATPTIQQALRDSVIGARAHYARLRQLTAQREVKRPELIRAKAFLASR